MRALTAFILIGLLLCAARAQEADDSFETASEADSDAGVAADSLDSPAAAAEAPEPSSRKKQAAAVISVDKLSAVVYSADGKKQATSSGSLGDKLFKGNKLGTGQSVEVSFTPLLDGSAFKPQQAMLMAGSKSTPGLSAYAVGGKAKKDGSITISLSTAALEKQIANVGGELELSLLLGDPSAPVGLSGPLGSVVLPEAASGAAPSPKLLSAAHQPVSNIKPNIAHAFRPPAKRGPAVVSLTFTGLALAPLALLVIYLAALGANIKGLPSGASTLWVLLFHGGIASLLGLYLMFWIRLDLATTMPLVLGLGLFTAGTGYKALSALSAARLAAEGSKAGSGAVAVAKKTN